jgi:hypothetical protein
VRIYDYVEPDHRLTAEMYRKRTAAYREMGYSIQFVGSDRKDTIQAIRFFQKPTRITEKPIE